MWPKGMGPGSGFTKLHPFKRLSAVQGSWSRLCTSGAHTAHQPSGKGKDDNTLWYFYTPPNSEQPALTKAGNTEFTLLPSYAKTAPVNVVQGHFAKCNPARGRRTCPTLELLPF